MRSQEYLGFSNLSLFGGFVQFIQDALATLHEFCLVARSNITFSNEHSKFIPKMFVWQSHRESFSSHFNGGQHSRRSQLIHDFDSMEAIWSLGGMRFDASNPVWQSGIYSGEQLIELVLEMATHREQLTLDSNWWRHQGGHKFVGTALEHLQNVILEKIFVLIKPVLCVVLNFPGKMSHIKFLMPHRINVKVLVLFEKGVLGQVVEGLISGLGKGALCIEEIQNTRL
mmetsp:Transcript_6916/g.25822  ORF Transcript_6916/g.25822 Transcript_6916/m.25822 type:complete len:227 (+) Transcript_6916:1138-1818(+)